MKPETKLICIELLKKSVEYGFDSFYELQPIADKLGITEEIYNIETQSGLLWGLGGNIGEIHGLLDVDHEGTQALVHWETHDLLEAWSFLTSEEREQLASKEYKDEPTLRHHSNYDRNPPYGEIPKSVRLKGHNAVASGQYGSRGKVRGSVVHYVPDWDGEAWATKAALCGKKLGQRSAGWCSTEQPVSCPKCRKNLES